MPEADPLGQARDIARALETAQARATAWGGDPTKFILMGHSAGGHLVALLAASSSSRALGAVLLDSAALNVERIMGERHARFYDRAFGQERSYWRAASPIAALSRSSLPTLAVCSTRRTDSCPQAEAFAAEAMSLGASASVIRQHLSHREINKDLGADGAYTNAVEEFMGSLDPSVMRGLKGKL